MKTAIVHDFLVEKGGAEKVLDAIYSIYPADVHTLLQLGKWDYPKVVTSRLDSWFARKFHRYLFPLYPRAIETLDLSNYDLILSSSHAFAKNVMTYSNQLHICYCHSPLRSIYDLYHEHLKYLNPLQKKVFEHFSHNVRSWDLVSSNRVDHFLANSKFIARRIEKTYGRKVGQVIYPPVDVERFQGIEKKEDYYIFLGRLVPYKGIELIIEAFSYMKDKKLLVVGTGPLEKKLKSYSYKNIEVLGYQSDAVCAELLKKAKGFIFMGIEDFGISLVEALAAGTPLLALNGGGAVEILEHPNLGEFVKEKSISSLIESIKRFEMREFDSLFIQNAVKKYSKERFLYEFRKFVNEKCSEFFGS